MSDIAGSPAWQTVIFSVAGLFLLFSIWRGWRAGIIRSGVQLGALIAATVISLIIARVAAFPFGGIEQMPGFLVALFAGAISWLAVYCAIAILSALLFKRTGQQGGGLFHFLWGAGGAVFGFLIGLVLLWGAVSIIRGLGAMAEMGYSSRHTVRHPANPSLQEPPKDRSSLPATLIKLKNSLELGPAGQAVETVDPIPNDVYSLIQQIGQLTGNEQAMVRFINYPDIQRLLQTPRMNQVLSDPSVIEAAQKGNVLALISNKALIEAVEDPAFAEQLKKIDFREAMKFALASPTPSPAPSSSPPRKTK